MEGPIVKDELLKNISEGKAEDVAGGRPGTCYFGECPICHGTVIAGKCMNCSYGHTPYE